MSHSFSFEAEGLILHRYPFQQGLLVKFLTQEAGLLPCVLKQNRGQKNMIVQPLSWITGRVSGQGEVKTLKEIEVLENVAPLSHKPLCATLYFVELVLTFIKPGEIYPSLLPALKASIHALSEQGLEPSLRSFELYFMELVGYGLHLTQDEEGKPLQASEAYICLPGLFPQRLVGRQAPKGALILQGEALVSIHERHFEDAACLKNAKHLLRQWIDYHAHGKVFKSRELFYTSAL
jgi:DNA repair protein RecO (recombination protein O)